MSNQIAIDAIDLRIGKTHRVLVFDEDGAITLSLHHPTREAAIDAAIVEIDRLRAELVREKDKPTNQANQERSE